MRSCGFHVRSSRSLVCAVKDSDSLILPLKLLLLIFCLCFHRKYSHFLQENLVVKGISNSAFPNWSQQVCLTRPSCVYLRVSVALQSVQYCWCLTLLNKSLIANPAGVCLHHLLIHLLLQTQLSGHFLGLYLFQVLFVTLILATLVKREVLTVAKRSFL